MSSLTRQWHDCGEWTLGTCPSCGTEGKDVKALTEALDELVHACEDTVDDYDRIGAACEAAINLLPNYVPKLP